MANGHGGRRAGAGRKPEDDAKRLRTLAQNLCADGLKEMARLALKATSESVRTRAFDRLFKVAYGKELEGAIGPQEVIRQIPRWAATDEEATLDPAYQDLDRAR